MSSNEFDCIIDMTEY